VLSETVVRIELTFILFFAAYSCATSLVRAQSTDLVGRWKVEITFDQQPRTSLNFEAEDSGKGSFLLEGRKSNWAEPPRPSAAKWTESGEKHVTFSGPVNFPIGNVGRQSGTLVFKGRFEKDNLISGEVAFFSAGQDPFDPNVTPVKTGKFKATRVNSD